ncbi:MAG: HAMP domain-containing sensor histidine kinase [Clostridia bacterium]
MISKLRRKIVLTNMLLVTFVLIIVFVSICVSTSKNLENGNRYSLSLALNRPQDDPFLPFEKENPSSGSMSPVLIIMTDDDGNILYTSKPDFLSISNETKMGAIAAVLNNPEKSYGVLDGYSIIYMYSDTKYGVKIALMDTSRQIAAMEELILTSLMLGILGLFAFFFISMFLANLALRPITNAWRQQRRFIADASHELKTPLTVILANSEILLKNIENSGHDENQKWLENTKSEALRMKALVSDMLYLAKSDDKRIKSVFSEMNLSETVLSETLTFESVSFEKGLIVNSDIVENINILGDEKQIRQLIGILLDNALKYSVYGGSIDVTLKKEQAKAVLSIKNFGDPISPSDIDFIFDRFYRGDRSRLHNGGFGLGLSIARSIVDAHGGKIIVKSDPKHGTEFIVLLTLKAHRKIS